MKNLYLKHKFLQLKIDNIKVKWRNALNRHFNNGTGMLTKHIRASTVIVTTEIQVKITEIVKHILEE